MPRNSGRIPKYGLHKATGQARVVLDGRTHYLGKYGTEESRRKYGSIISAWIAGNRQLAPESGGPSDLAVSELLLAYLRFAEGYYVKNGKATSELHCIKWAVRPLEKLHGRSPVVDFSPLRLKAVRQQMISDGLSRGVINHNVSRIRRIFRWGVEQEFVPASVYHGLQAVQGLPKGRSEARETEPVKPVPDEHVDAVRPSVSPQVWAMIELQRLTGMRPGEARTMRGRNLDMSGPIWEYRPSEHKTEHHDKQRVIPLGSRAQAVIQPFLKAELTAYLFSPRDAEAARGAERRQNRKTPMTPSQKTRKPKGRRLNDYYSKDAYITAVRRACNKAGVPAWHPNQLRHTSDTQIRKELGLEAAQVWLGHAKADVTQIYAERNLELARQIAARFG